MYGTGLTEKYHENWLSTEKYVRETEKPFVLLSPFSEMKNTHGSALNAAWEQTLSFGNQDCPVL